MIMKSAVRIAASPADPMVSLSNKKSNLVEKESIKYMCSMVSMIFVNFSLSLIARQFHPS